MGWSAKGCDLFTTRLLDASRRSHSLCSVFRNVEGFGSSTEVANASLRTHDLYRPVPGVSAHEVAPENSDWNFQYLIRDFSAIVHQ